MLYCEDCGEELPALSREHHQIYAIEHRKAVEAIKRYRRETGASLENTPLQELRKTALDKYEELSGHRPKNKDFDNLWHRVDRSSKH